MSTYDRNVINVQVWQQQVMDLHDKVDVLERRCSTLEPIVKMLEERANNLKERANNLKLTETDAPGLVKLNRMYDVAMTNLAHYSTQCEERAIEFMVGKHTLDVERSALLAHMDAVQAMQREAGELQREAEQSEHTSEEPL
jgi:hypothetical protein